MGNEISGTYNHENPRRVKDLAVGKKIAAEMTGQMNDLEEGDLEFIMNMTAPQFQTLSYMAMMAGMAMAMDDPKIGDKLAAKWKPWVDIVNQTDQAVTVSMWNTWPELRCEESDVVIEAGQTGKLALPKEVDFNRDYPLNPILRERKIEVLFSDGEMRQFNCNSMNHGMSRGDMVILPNGQFEVCGELPATPKPPPTAEDEAETKEIAEFMGETMAPNCPQPTKEFTDELATRMQRWLKLPAEQITV